MGETLRSGRKTWQAAGLALFVVSGCGSDAAAPPGPSDYVPRDGGSSDATGDTKRDAPLGADAASLGDARSTSFGDLPIVDIADTPCVPASAPATLLSDVASTAGGFEKMGQLG